MYCNGWKDANKAIEHFKAVYHGKTRPSEMLFDISAPDTGKGRNKGGQPAVGVIYGCGFVIVLLNGHMYGRRDLIAAFRQKCGLAKLGSTPVAPAEARGEKQ